MPQIWLLANNSTSPLPVVNQVVGIAIWVGVALLTLALLILMRTRWGQVQPLSKCVVLSVFAHLLLLIFAYGTKLLESPRQLGKDEAIQLAFVTTDRPPREGEEQAEPTPWEDFLPGESAQPDAAPAPRREVAAAPLLRSTPRTDTTIPETMPRAADVIPEAEPREAIAQHQVPTPRVPPPAAAAPAPIEPAPAPARSPATPQPVPAAPVPDRVETAAVVQRTAPPAPETQLPTELFTNQSRMQQLADVNVHTEVPDARAGGRDQLAESENRDSSRVDSAGQAQGPVHDGGAKNLVALPSTAPIRRQLHTEPAQLFARAVAEIPLRLGDGQPLPEPYRLRSIPQRKEVAVGLGASAKAAAAVDAALAWLAAQQENDGSWDASRWAAGVERQIAGHDREGAGADADTGITGLAVLALLANGQTHLEGPYRKNVQRGLEYLLRNQGPDGNLAGSARLYARMYCHGMALLALSEALAMTGDERIRPYVEHAVHYTVDAQHPTSGGWRYQPQDQGDMSQFGWQVMALKSADLAGVRTPQATREGMLHFLQRCEHGRHGGKSGYRPGSPPSRPMTAEALACRYFLNLAPSDQLVQEATEFLLGELPQAGQPNLYYWYYGTLALFHVQGPAWEQWNAAMQEQLLRLQRTDGHLAGSWDSDTVWGCYGGRVYSTAMATLCLEVYYRYLPLTALRSPSGQLVR